MEEEKIKIYKAIDGDYYRFHYNRGYVVAKSRGGYDCYYGLKTTEISDDDGFWPEYPCFSAADYCTPAPDDEISWLEFCVKEGELFSKADFLANHYVKTGDVSKAMHTKEQLIGRKFTTATGSLYTLTDSPNTCNFLYVEWCKEDGHIYNGRSKYSLREVNTYLTKKTWILTDTVPQEVSNYSIF